MWPILIGLLFTIAISIDRILYLLWNYTTPADPTEQITDSPQVADLLKRAGRLTLLDRILPGRDDRLRRDAGIRLADTFMTQTGIALESRLASLRSLGTLLQERMLKRVEALQTIASLSPLFGLLGTVQGMMQAFHALAVTGGQADIAVLADGIWIAMITTAFGLIAAIPAQLMYNFFMAQIDSRLQRMNRFQDRLLQLYHQGKLA